MHKEHRGIYQPPPERRRSNIKAFAGAAAVIATAFVVEPFFPDGRTGSSEQRVENCVNEIKNPGQLQKHLRMVGANSASNPGDKPGSKIERDLTTFQYTHGDKYPMLVTGKVNPPTEWALCNVLEDKIYGK